MFSVSHQRSSTQQLLLFLGRRGHLHPTTHRGVAIPSTCLASPTRRRTHEDGHATPTIRDRARPRSGGAVNDGRAGGAAIPRVLLIDPYGDEGDMYAEYLRTVGFEVECCVEAVDGLRSAADRAPDIVVTRLRQFDPLLNGIRIARRLKRSGSTRHVPVVIITTSTLAADREAGTVASDAYLLLPVTPNELAAQLRRLLRQETSGRGEPPPGP